MWFYRRMCRISLARKSYIHESIGKDVLRKGVHRDNTNTQTRIFGTYYEKSQISLITNRNSGKIRRTVPIRS